MRPHNRTVLLGLALLPACLYSQSGSLSIISGVLQTEDGKRVDALVHAIRIPSAPSVPGQAASTPAPTQPKQVRVSGKSKDATFSFTGLDAGMYELCATVPDGGYLDPCRWEKNGVLINVPPLQIVKGVTITLKKASTIKVHVTDPDHLMRNSPQGHLLMGVFGPGNHFFPMVRKNDDSQSKDYELSIPFDTDIT